MSTTDYTSYMAGFAAGQEVRQSGSTFFGFVMGALVGVIGTALVAWRFATCL